MGSAEAAGRARHFAQWMHEARISPWPAVSRNLVSLSHTRTYAAGVAILEGAR